MQSFLTELVGVSFRPAEAKEVVDALTIGQELTLERDPNNEYDSNAIKVIADVGEGDSGPVEVFIGFIKSSGGEAAEIAPFLDDGWTARVYVTSILGKRRCGLKVELYEAFELESYRAEDSDK